MSDYAVLAVILTALVIEGAGYTVLWDMGVARRLWAWAYNAVDEWRWNRLMAEERADLEARYPGIFDGPPLTLEERERIMQEIRERVEGVQARGVP